MDDLCGYTWHDEPNGLVEHQCGLDKYHWPEDHKCWAFTGEPGDGVRCGVTSKAELDQ